VELPQVITFVAALTGQAALGDRVVVVSEDDPAARSPWPISYGAGYQVTLVYQSPAPSPQVGKYSIRLDAGPARRAGVWIGASPHQVRSECHSQHDAVRGSARTRARRAGPASSDGVLADLRDGPETGRRASLVPGPAS